MKAYIHVGLAGAAGALSRYLLGLLVTFAFPSPMPWGTLLINLTGSFLLGALTGLGIHRGLIPHGWRAPLTTGFVGAYTTFSTWAVDTVRLWETGHWGYAAANIGLSLSLGLPLAWLGLHLTSKKEDAPSD
ncbi:MAG TPA: fluoride efflux transporter CrcB [Symbiobacteriaceae bacterium]|nr:fluoride efflux transporter CrcB [Symbiobacteriaceae bacterium]